MIIDRYNDDYYEDERLYSTGDYELDELMERAFCDGYDYAQREFNSKSMKELNNKRAEAVGKAHYMLRNRPTLANDKVFALNNGRANLRRMDSDELKGLGKLLDTKENRIHKLINEKAEWQKKGRDLGGDAGKYMRREHLGHVMGDPENARSWAEWNRRKWQSDSKSTKKNIAGKLKEKLRNIDGEEVNKKLGDLYRNKKAAEIKVSRRVGEALNPLMELGKKQLNGDKEGIKSIDKAKKAYDSYQKKVLDVAAKTTQKMAPKHKGFQPTAGLDRAIGKGEMAKAAKSYLNKLKKI